MGKLSAVSVLLLSVVGHIITNMTTLDYSHATVLQALLYRLFRYLILNYDCGTWWYWITHISISISSYFCCICQNSIHGIIFFHIPYLEILTLAVQRLCMACSLTSILMMTTWLVQLTNTKCCINGIIIHCSWFTLMFLPSSKFDMPTMATVSRILNSMLLV